jgi:hypothetical protein
VWSISDLVHLLLIIDFAAVVTVTVLIFSATFIQYFCSLNFLFLQNKDVTEAIQKVAAAYDCKIVEGVLSHQLKQFVIDGNKVILSVSNPDTRVDDAEFEENEVYAVDIVTSTGEGKVIIE